MGMWTGAYNEPSIPNTLINTAVLKDDFPLRAFSVRYARKDLNHARQLAQSAGIDEQSSQKIDALFSKAIDAGDGDRYWPVISRLISE